MRIKAHPRVRNNFAAREYIKKNAPESFCFLTRSAYDSEKEQSCGCVQKQKTPLLHPYTRGAYWIQALRPIIICGIAIICKLLLYSMTVRSFLSD